ncbi:MAG: DEAD/DEAH box helicase [Clostridiales bacterium]|jgi:superfamily II DNA/RNA helicase|nr:DEAD/DEAH box helicase [Clostridiales bacterium]
MNATLTDEQQAVINALRDGKNILVEARVGSGKTTIIQPLIIIIKCFTTKSCNFFKFYLHFITMCCKI